MKQILWIGGLALMNKRKSRLILHLDCINGLISAGRILSDMEAKSSNGGELLWLMISSLAKILSQYYVPQSGSDVSAVADAEAASPDEPGDVGERDVAKRHAT